MATKNINGVISELTAEEEAAFNASNEICIANKAAEEAEETQRVANKAAGTQKLLDLGLTQAEVDALTK